ncbi:D-glycero-beta-D-manno-heptose-7-phosphate kinase [Candidatus Odyssella thessalonicensis]|uniref:D-glycero-beta-D-manno-heptose-7-phosphate kinase n=1 Tax=Candidatus Odyssella thessalonicensis TaxID=84647 RepID=UPI000225AC39|nr:D-glycero-beta-D-manno-heptose-7-phosphate kinase [Candidatus Odyssella thessalonicensis]
MHLNSQAIEKLEHSNEKRILCLGDCMLDKFVYGQVSRISPEAPVPVFQESYETRMLGGAANVAANIGAYDCSVDFISVIGSDEEGDTFQHVLQNHPRITPYLVIDAARPTTTKIRFVTNSQHLLRVDKEVGTEISQELQAQIIAHFNTLIEKCDSVLLSDYRKGFFSPDLTQHLIHKARSRNKTIIVDPKGTDYSKYQGASLLTPNRSELSTATGLPVTTDHEIATAAQYLIDKFDIGAVLVTRSEQGMSLITADRASHISTEAKQVYDVSGAGDTSVATLALALACEIDLTIACEIANIAAGIVVGKSGTALVYRDELLNHLCRKYRSHLPEKLTDLATAQLQIQRWKAAGKRIGFTNGCFDLVHPGHVTLLKKAKQLCDFLIVGLNSDVSVKGLKGEQRPIQNEQARAAILSALGDVDLTIIFDEPTPINLITALQPDVLIKGSDYTIDQVVGADIVQARGGTVALIDLVPNHSTTNIVKKLST